MGALWGLTVGCWQDPYAADPMLAKSYNDTFVPAVAGRPYQPYSKVCPEPPPPPPPPTPPPAPVGHLTVLYAVVQTVRQPDGSRRCPPTDPTLTAPPPGSRLLGRNGLTHDAAYIGPDGKGYIFLVTYDQITGDAIFSRGQVASAIWANPDASALSATMVCRYVAGISIG